MKLPKDWDTTEMAKCQDLIFSDQAKPETAQRFCDLMFLQEEIGPTNLTLRQRLIMSDYSKVGMDSYKNEAISQFHALRNGLYWAEGYSYWNYVLTGLEWYRKRHGLPEDVIAVTEQITASYDAIKPCPLPEVADMGEPGDGPDYVSTPNYFQKRFRNPDGTVRAYLIIALNTEAERANFHSHLEAGYFAFWVKHEVPGVIATDGDGVAHKIPMPTAGIWFNRCKPYTGFNFKESFTSSSLAACLPSGAMPPTWRVKPPKVTVQQGFTWPGITKATGVVTGYAFKFTWDNGLFSKQSRIILVHLDENKVVVTDQGGWIFSRKTVREYSI